MSTYRPHAYGALDSHCIGFIHTAERKVMDLNPEGTSDKLYVFHRFRGNRLIETYQVFVKRPCSLRDDFLRISFKGE